MVPSIVVCARISYGAPKSGLVETGPTVLVATALHQQAFRLHSVPINNIMPCTMYVGVVIISGSSF